MRILKWLAGIAIVIVLVAIIVHLRRDSIARGIANSVLEEQGFVAAELKVDSLSPNRLELELLVIESESGARYEISGLSLPLSVTSEETTYLTAERLTVTYATERDQQRMLSTTLATVFELPATQAGFDARVSTIMLPGMSQILDADFRADYDGLTLAFFMNDIHIAAALTKGPAGRDMVALGAISDGGVVLELDLEFAREDIRYSAAGEFSASLGPWLPTLRDLGLVPPGLQRLDVNLDGELEIRLDEAAPGHAVVDLELGAGDGAAISYRVAGGRTSDFVTSTTETLAVDFHYPANDWQMRVENASGTFSTDGLSTVPVAIEDLSCKNGILCTLNALVDAQAIGWNDYTVDAATLSLPLTVSTGESTRVAVSAEASGEFHGLRSEGITAALVTVIGFTGTEIVVDDAWHCRIDELQLAFDDLAAGNDLLVSPGITLRELDVTNSGETVAGKIAVSAPFDGRWKDVALSLPGATGAIAFDNEELLATVDIVDLNDAIAGSVVWRRNAAADTGALEVKNGWASFDRARLSDYAPGGSLPFDILQGNWDIDLQLQWQSTQGIPQYRGTAAMSLTSIGGTYTDIAMLGLTTELAASIDPAEGLALRTAPVAVRLLDVGVPIENIEFEYNADFDHESLDITGLSFDVFGGKVTADPFEYAFASETNDIMLHARDIQLQLMVDTLEFESLELTGTISGELPVTMTDDKIIVSDGQMDNDSPGIIRYLPPTGALDAVAPEGGLGAITQTLTNFEFETLSSTVNYTEGGDMKFLMRVVGVNPDIDPDQPYAFNLDLENNIPQMLRSLRAVRSIEDILKQRTEN